MRILHIGFGFRPWIVNGLIIYAQDLMEAQARGGHEVGYFFPARQIPVIRRPFLHTWRQNGVRMFELVNSTLVVGRHSGSPDPDQDLAHAPTELAFARVLARFRPDVIHIHDLGGLPSSIPEIAQQRGVRAVMTLHDYFALCPTVKLYDVEDRVCLRREPGEMCSVCCADAPLDNHDELKRTLWYTLTRAKNMPYLGPALRHPATGGLRAGAVRLVKRAAGLRAGGDAPSADDGAPGEQAPARRPRAAAAAYQRRRDRNLERLSRLDALITYSNRTNEILRHLGVDPDAMRLLRINPAHIETLRPKRRTEPHTPIRFEALNVANSTQKGADLVVEALGHLSRRGLNDRFRLTIRGWVSPHVLPALSEHPAVELPGSYATPQLDGLLEQADVGMVPSVWEDNYPFVGLEFLAKGLPIIGNALGGIRDYCRPGETGWLNRSSSAEELAELMTRAIEHPDEVQQLSASVISRRDEFVRPFSGQLADLDALYAEVLGRSWDREPTPVG